MSRVVSYRPDKLWLAAKAAELRRLAERMEARSWDALDHDPSEGDDGQPQ